MNAVLVAVLAYVLLQLGFAFWLSRRVKTEEDYLVAGRRLGPWLAVFTVFATWFGAETCIGAAGEAYVGGLASVRIDPFGYAIAVMVTGLLFGAAIWRRKVMTLADLFRQRYGLGVERFAAIIMIPTSLLWAAAQVRAFGQVLAASSDLGVSTAITVAALVVIVYTAVGGLWADAASDLLQGVVLIAGLIVMFVLFLGEQGAERLAQLPPDRLSLGGGDQSWLGLIEAFAVPICGTIVAQELAARMLAMRSERLARNATVAAGALYLLVGLIPVLLGLVAGGLVGELDEPEQVLMHVAQRFLPAALYAVFVGALVSAILSTVDSALLVAGSLAAHNLLLPMKPALGETARLRFNRVAVVAFGVIAYGLALASEGVYALVEEASSLGSSGLLVILVGALWLPRFGGRAAAGAALATGLAVYVLGAHLWALRYPYVLSLLGAAVAYGTVALLTMTAVQEAIRSDSGVRRDR